MDVEDSFNSSELADQFAEVVGEARSEGGLVTVKVDRQGRVAEIRLDPKLTGVSAGRLAEAITTVCGNAFDDRIDQLAGVVDKYELQHGLPPDVLNFLHASVASLRRQPPRPRRHVSNPKSATAKTITVSRQ